MFITKVRKILISFVAIINRQIYKRFICLDASWHPNIFQRSAAKMPKYLIL